MTGYPGAKAGAGVYQTIINAMPPHEVYFEPFVGSGAILQRKKPAPCSIVADADAAVAAAWSTIASGSDAGSLIALHGDARSIIAKLGERITSRWLIYADPPYVGSTRRSRRPIYRHEMTDGDHRELIALLRSLPAAVMLSGYRCELYDDLLADWQRRDFRTMTRRGPALESLWTNFEPRELHDYKYLGGNFRERERIKRKAARWSRRIAALPELERRAVLEQVSPLLTMAAARPSSSEMAIGAGAGGIVKCGGEDLRGILSPFLARRAIAARGSSAAAMVQAALA